MSADVVSIYDYAPRSFRPAPTEDAEILILPVVRRPKHCCAPDCDELGVVAIDLVGENGSFAGTKFFCQWHEPLFPGD